MAKAHTLRELAKLSDEDLIELHDREVKHTVVGMAHFEDELHRREARRGIAASERLARAAYRLSWANFVAAITAVIVSVVAIVVTR